MSRVPGDHESRLFINNEFVASSGQERVTLVNPWDESTIASDLHIATDADVDAAVTAAEAALRAGPWNGFTGAQRAATMLKFAQLVEQNADRLAYWESLPTGRPVSIVKGFDIANLADVYRYYAGWADKIAGKSFSEDNGVYKIVRSEPVGVCAGIASWNATFAYIGWKIAPALAAGCTFIFKASEKSPLGVLALAPLYVEAGFPPGVVQFVNGGAATGSLLASHPRINKISFTGSVAAGRAIQIAATKSNLKRVTLELGGKSPAIVFDDAPFETAVQGVAAFLFNSGQICAACSRVLVQEDIAPKFQDAVKAAFESISSTMGPSPQDPGIMFGPVVDKLQYDRVMRYVEVGRADATLLTGGSRKEEGERGCIIEPTIFTNPKVSSAIWTEEIFGPVMVMTTFKTEEEAVRLANDTMYGLAAAVYTSSLDRALRMSSALESGGVSVNAPFAPEVQTPFGGTKLSGTGRELGQEGLEAYLEKKTVLIKLGAV